MLISKRRLLLAAVAQRRESQHWSGSGRQISDQFEGCLVYRASSRPCLLDPSDAAAE